MPFIYSGVKVIYFIVFFKDESGFLIEKKVKKLNFCFCGLDLMIFFYY